MSTEPSYTTEIPRTADSQVSVTDITWSGNMVTVSGAIREHVVLRNTIKVTVTATYASSGTPPSAQDNIADAEDDPGAPVSLPPSTTPPPTTSGFDVEITPSIDGTALDKTGTGPIQVPTNAPIQITAQLRRNGRLTRGTLFFSVEGPAGAILEKLEGTTDTEAKVTTLLTLGTSEGQYKFIVKLESDALEDDPATQIDETAPIKLDELIFEATEGPGASASAIVISGPSAVDPRGGSMDGRISLTFKVTTTGR